MHHLPPTILGVAGEFFESMYGFSSNITIVPRNPMTLRYALEEAIENIHPPLDAALLTRAHLEVDYFIKDALLSEFKGTKVTAKPGVTPNINSRINHSQGLTR